jgi:hypothetical protein
MHPRRRRRVTRRLWTAVVAALALPVSMLATGTTPAQAATVQCSVDYKTNDWGSGFTADLTLTNRGTDAINGWTLTYAYAGNQKLSNGWNGTWSQSGSAVSVTNASYNGTIAAGAAVSTGAQFSYSGTNTAPASFAVNGTTCAGAHQPPITVLTSPSAGAIYTQGPRSRSRRPRRRPTTRRSARSSSTTTPRCSARTRARRTLFRPPD